MSKRVFHQRPAYPSWSWASWSGKCKWLVLGFLKPATVIYKQKTNGRLQRLKQSENPVWIPQLLESESRMHGWNFDAHHGQYATPPYNTGRMAQGSDSGLLIFWSVSATFLLSEASKDMDPWEKFDAKNYTACNLRLTDGQELTDLRVGDNIRKEPQVVVPRKWWERQLQAGVKEFRFHLVGLGDEQVGVLLTERIREFWYRIAPHFIHHHNWIAAKNHEWELVLLA